MKTRLAACILIAASSAAYADGPMLPAYDVDANCLKAATAPIAITGPHAEPGSTYTPKPGAAMDAQIKGCIFAEQQAYDSLKASWDVFLPITKNRCIRLLTGANSWYQSLDSCVVQFGSFDRDQAARAAQGDKFKP
jgi:hypothetical protein